MFTKQTGLLITQRLSRLFISTLQS